MTATPTMGRVVSALGALTPGMVNRCPTNLRAALVTVRALRRGSCRAAVIRPHGRGCRRPERTPLMALNRRSCGGEETEDLGVRAGRCTAPASLPSGRGCRGWNRRCVAPGNPSMPVARRALARTADANLTGGGQAAACSGGGAVPSERTWPACSSLPRAGWSREPLPRMWTTAQSKRSPSLSLLCCDCQLRRGLLFPRGRCQR